MFKSGVSMSTVHNVNKLTMLPDRLTHIMSGKCALHIYFNAVIRRRTITNRRDVGSASHNVKHSSTIRLTPLGPFCTMYGREGGEFEALASWNSWPDDDDIMTTANFSNKVTTSVLLTAICTCFLQDCCRRHCHLWAQVQKTSLHHWSIGPGTLKNTVLTLEAASHFVRPQPSPTRVCLLYLRPIDICHSSGYRPACIAS